MKKRYAMCLLASSFLELTGCQAAVAAGPKLGNATVAADMNELSQIESFENGPLDVQVLAARVK